MTREELLSMPEPRLVWWRGERFRVVALSGPLCGESHVLVDVNDAWITVPLEALSAEKKP